MAIDYCSQLFWLSGFAPEARFALRRGEIVDVDEYLRDRDAIDNVVLVEPGKAWPHRETPPGLTPVQTPPGLTPVRGWAVVVCVDRTTAAYIDGHGPKHHPTERRVVTWRVTIQLDACNWIACDCPLPWYPPTYGGRSDGSDVVRLFRGPGRTAARNALGGRW